MPRPLPAPSKRTLRERAEDLLRHGISAAALRAYATGIVQDGRDLVIGLVKFVVIAVGGTWLVQFMTDETIIVVTEFPPRYVPRTGTPISDLTLIFLIGVGVLAVAIGYRAILNVLKILVAILLLPFALLFAALRPVLVRGRAD